MHTTYAVASFDLYFHFLLWSKHVVIYCTYVTLQLCYRPALQRYVDAYKPNWYVCGISSTQVNKQMCFFQGWINRHKIKDKLAWAYATKEGIQGRSPSLATSCSGLHLVFDWKTKHLAIIPWCCFSFWIVYFTFLFTTTVGTSCTVVFWAGCCIWSLPALLEACV